MLNIKRLYYSLKVRIAIGVVKQLDSDMKKAGWKRHERRRFWREFIRDKSKILKMLERKQ